MSKNNMLEYKKYYAAINFSAEDNLFIGRIVGINDVLTFHGSTVEEVTRAFRETIDDYLATCARLGRSPNKPYSGKVTLRISPELHAQADAVSKSSGESLNSVIAKALNDFVAEKYV